MSIARIIKCDCCEAYYTEEIMGDGFPGWGQISGKTDEHGNTIFGLCPEHLNIVFEFIKSLKG